jgi:hypothetical protein
MGHGKVLFPVRRMIKKAQFDDDGWSILGDVPISST